MAIIASTGKVRNKIESLWRVADAAWFGRDVATYEQAPNILNGEYLIGVNAAGTGTVQMIGVNSSNQVVLPNGAITPSGSVNLSTTVNLSAANINALHATPIALVAAPGAGLALVVDQLVFEMTTTATGFAAGSVIRPIYHTAGTVLTGNTIPTTTVTAGAGVSYTLLSLGAIASGLVLAANDGVDIASSGTEFTTGTGTAKVICFYRIITL